MHSPSTARRDRLDTAIAAMAADSEFTPIVRRLGCLRGVLILIGLALAVEIGDWHRFTGKTVGPFVGLVPSEHPSWASRTQGAIIKTGNTHVQRVLVEAACHHRARYVTGRLCVTDGSSRRRQPEPAGRGQPAAARPLDRLQPAPQTPRDRQRRRRP